MDSLRQAIQSLGPQIFDMTGDLTLWVSIIGTTDKRSVNQLIQMIENKNSVQKYNLADRILRDGWHAVATPGVQRDTAPEVTMSEASEPHPQQPSDAKDDDSDQSLTPDLSEEISKTIIEPMVETIEKQEQTESGDKTEAIDAEEELPSSGTYADASPELLSPESYKTCVDSPEKANKLPTKEKCESDSFPSMAISTPTSTFKRDSEERAGSQSLTLSPITLLFSNSHNKLNLSPTISLNMSSTSSHSPKSYSSFESTKSHSKRSPKKTTDKIIEEYKSLVPYESYCSEEKFFGNPTDETNHSIVSESLCDKVIEQNVKNLNSDKN